MRAGLNVWECVLCVWMIAKFGVWPLAQRGLKVCNFTHVHGMQYVDYVSNMNWTTGVEVPCGSYTDYFVDRIRSNWIDAERACGEQNNDFDDGISFLNHLFTLRQTSTTLTHNIRNILYWNVFELSPIIEYFNEQRLSIWMVIFRIWIYVK